MTLRGPFSCPRVLMWLVTASLLCVVAWYLTLAGWTFVSGSRTIERTPFDVISYATILGGSGVAYTLILGQSKWFIGFRPLIRWIASLGSAILLTLLFAFVFQIALAFYAGW
jgi:hypothetical protein